MSESVLRGHYVNPTLWRKSNRSYLRILAGLPPDLAVLFGYIEDQRERLLSRELEVAKDQGDWSLVADLERLKREPLTGSGAVPLL